MNKTIKSKNYKEILKGHCDIILDMCLNNQDNLLSVSSDGAFKQWNIGQRKIDLKIALNRNPKLSNGIPEEKTNISKEIPEENTNVERFELTSAILNDNYYIGGYKDGLIIQWDANGEIMSFFEGHQKQINNLITMDKDYFLSSSSDNTIRIWKFSRPQPRKIYRFEEVMKTMEIYQTRLFCIGNENTLYIIDLQKDLIVSRLYFPERLLSYIIRWNNSIILSTRDSYLEFYDIADLEDHKIIRKNKVFVNGGWIFSLKVWQNYLFACCDDKVIKVFNMKTWEILEELYGHEDTVSCIVIGSKFIFTGSYDHTIRSWDIGEMENRIRERKIMEKEEIISLKIEAYNKAMDKKTKKKVKKTNEEEKIEETAEIKTKETDKKKKPKKKAKK